MSFRRSLSSSGMLQAIDQIQGSEPPPSPPRPDEPPSSPTGRRNSKTTPSVRRRVLSSITSIPGKIGDSIKSQGHEELRFPSDSGSFLDDPERRVTSPPPVNLMRKFDSETMQRLHEFPVKGKIKILLETPLTDGTFCVVYKGILRREGQKDGDDVALKALKVGRSAESDAKSFRHEANTWAKLRHRNILPFLGTFTHEDHIYLVSPWAHSGPLIHYLKRKPDADSQALLIQIANALTYLHDECKILHGDLKGDNVLISASGDALVRDFELATRLENVPGATELDPALRLAMTYRFCAPELLAVAHLMMDREGPSVNPVKIQVTDYDGPLSHLVKRQATLNVNQSSTIHAVKSKATDVFAFGMVILEVYTLEPPWGNLKTGEVLLQVMLGNKPPRPEGEAVARGFTPTLWKLVEQCLDTDPARRPQTADIARYLSEESMSAAGVDLSQDIFEAHSVILGKPQTPLWEGELRRRGRSGERVLLKKQKNVRRLHVQGQKALQREIQALASIQHLNILPVYGMATIASEIFVVTPWMENRSITRYLREHAQANRFKLLRQMADALSYLHADPASTGPIIHGSLCPDNVLINNSGDVKLTDFGLSNILLDLEVPDLVGSPVSPYTVRFLPPEFFFYPNYRATAPGDTYSFAMVTLEVLTGNVPFADIPNSVPQVIMRITQGPLPERPRTARGAATVNDSTWKLLTDCWNQNAEARPRMAQIHARLPLIVDE